MNLYEAYLIMKELLLSVLTVKTEAYFFFLFFGVFFFVWVVYVYVC